MELVNKSYCTAIKTILEKDKTITYNLVLQNRIGISSLFSLEIGNFVNISLFKKRCKVCRRSVELNVEYICIICHESLIKHNESYYTRKDCIYFRETSLLSRYSYCASNSPLCKNMQNAMYCHSKFILYVGRFNNEFKVGISSRKRGLYTRVVEQGLNEAIIIDGINNLMEALFHEECISNELKIETRISTQDKLLSFVSTENNNDNMQFISNKFADYINSNFNLQMINLRYFYLNNSFNLIDNKIQLERTDTDNSGIKGKIIFLQGNFMVLSLEEKNYLIDLKKLVGRDVYLYDNITD